MSDSDSDRNDDFMDGGDGPSIEVVYPLNEETEVPQTNAQLFKTVLKEGTGSKPPRGSKVTVSYKGTLAADGSCFDSSDSFDFTLGTGSVIKGWDQGVATMRKGERAILRCLPEYAYGKAGSGGRIPPNSTLNFEVEVLDWTKDEDVSEAKDKSIMKKVEAEGTGWDKPEYESEVVINVTAYSGSDAEENKVKLFSRDNWKVTIGETKLPGGLETALKAMKDREHAIITVHGKHIDADPEFGIPRAGEQIIYDVSIASLTVVKTWNFKGQDKITEGAKRKDAGNELFKQGKWEAAEKKYRRCLEFVEHDYGFSETEKDEAKKVKVAALNNLAQVLINIRRYRDAITECNKVLTAEASNTKALFRRGKSFSALDEWDDAQKDFKYILELDANNADAARELEAVRAKVRAYDQQQKAKFGKLFA